MKYFLAVIMLCILAGYTTSSSNTYAQSKASYYAYKQKERIARYNSYKRSNRYFYRKNRHRSYSRHGFRHHPFRYKSYGHGHRLGHRSYRRRH